MTFIEGKREEETKTSALLSPLPPPSALDKRARPGFHRKTTKHAVSQHIKTNIGDSSPYYRGQTDTIRICTVYTGICGFCRGTITKRKVSRPYSAREGKPSQSRVPRFSYSSFLLETGGTWLRIFYGSCCWSERGNFRKIKEKMKGRKGGTLLFSSPFP